MKHLNVVRTTAATALLSLFAVSANASDLSYNYAELRFVDTEINSVDGDGFRLNGSFELTGNWLLVGGYSTLDFDSADLSSLEIGGGYVHRYNQQMDFVGYAKLVRAEVDVNGGGSDDDTGIALAGGVRGTFAPQFEGRALLNYVNVDETDTYFEVGADYYFNEQFSAGATLEFGGDADSLTIGVRWFFDK